MEINVALVKQLVTAQFPEWSKLPIKPVELSGWDNRTFHLGPSMLVRLPSAAGYTLQVAKEQRWLPRLAPHLPLLIPTPVAKGRPSHAYPWHWSIYQWIKGKNASIDRIGDMRQFATDLAQFLCDLQQIDTTGGPLAGAHSFYRGAPLAVYDTETCNAIEKLAGEINRQIALSIWEAACSTTWQKSPVWFHGDIAAGNLLVKNGKLYAVIDFGCAGIGDPACDLTIAWTFLFGESRDMFRKMLPLDDATWARGRGWALWKALITVVEFRNSDPVKAAKSRRIIDAVFDDHIKNAAMPVRKC